MLCKEDFTLTHANVLCMCFHLWLRAVLSKAFLHLNCAPRSGFHFLSWLLLAATEKPDRLCLGLCLQCILHKSKLNIFVTWEHCVPLQSQGSHWTLYCTPSLCLLSAPRFLLDGTGTLTSSIWNAGKTPVNAGSSTQWNNLWFVLFFLTDYKQKYGEEHGSCQAGIAAVFTEVSKSPCLSS